MQLRVFCRSNAWILVDFRTRFLGRNCSLEQWIPKGKLCSSYIQVRNERIINNHFVLDSATVTMETCREDLYQDLYSKASSSEKIISSIIKPLLIYILLYMLLGESHWICAYREAGSNTAIVLDSLGSEMDTSTHTLLQLATMFKPAAPADSINIQLKSVQQQQGLHDCGLFAIAFSVEVCKGNDASGIVFNQGKMRKHLQACLENGFMSLFPKAKNRKGANFSEERTVVEELYCICRMPEMFDERMISCDKCNKWYHCKCIRMPRGRKQFRCPKCRSGFL